MQKALRSLLTKEAAAQGGVKVGACRRYETHYVRDCAAQGRTTHTYKRRLAQSVVYLVLSRLLEKKANPGEGLGAGETTARNVRGDLCPPHH